MSSNNYYTNYYSNEPHQQQYTGYQVGSADNNNNVQSSSHSQQYEQAQVPVTTQSTQYMSCPTHSYTGQGAQNGTQQDGSWAGNYQANRGTTNRAAEALTNLSNSSYTSGNSAFVSSSSFTPTNAATSSQYSSNVHQTQQHSAQHDSRGNIPTSSTSHSQSQPRPRSVNATFGQATSTIRGLPSPVYSSQRVQAAYAQQQQRSASPAQVHYSQAQNVPLTPARASNMRDSTEFNDYNRAPPSLGEATRSRQTTTTSASYSYGSRNITAPPTQAARSNSTVEQYEQPAITVDPMAIYDPWPEYQRKQEALRAQQAAEDAARVESERKAEEIRRTEEESRRLETEQTSGEEQKAQQLPEAQKPALLPSTEKKPRKNQSKPKSKKQATKNVTAPAEIAASSQTSDTSHVGSNTEAEIRALMAKMRELNNKDPALLARIWEEERKGKGASSPIVQAQSAHPASFHVSPAMLSKTRPAATRNQKQAQTPIGNHNAELQPTQVLAVTQNAEPKAQMQSKPAAAVPNSSNSKFTRPTGSTIWPPEKKTQLAAAAVTYLNAIAENHDKALDEDRILKMLDSNPSYIELCEILEGKGIKLDRAAFARNLLSAVPDVNSASQRTAQAQGHTAPKPAPQPLPEAQMQRNGETNGRTKPSAPPPGVQASTTPQLNQSGEANSGYNAHYAPAVQAPYYSTPYPPFPNSEPQSTPTPAPMAPMLPEVKKETTKPALQPPANKEEAARKRNFSDMIDLTMMSDEDAEPAPKKLDVESAYPYTPPSSVPPSAMDPHHNFGNLPHTPATIAQQSPTVNVPQHQVVGNDLRSVVIVKPIERRTAARRSTYNIKTIARDVLLACGRHPDERQLNAHLDILKTALPQIDNNSDLSTVRWDIIDPGQPPRGFFKETNPLQEVDDADDEDESDEEASSSSVRAHIAIRQPIGVGGGGSLSTDPWTSSTNHPLKQGPKRRGRPPRSFYPSMTSRPYGFGDGEGPDSRASKPTRGRAGGRAGLSNTSSRPSEQDRQGAPISRHSATGSASVPRPGGSYSGTGYAAFRTIATTPDGTPVPKKKGRPVGWRKNIHGSQATQARAIDRSIPQHPSGLRNITDPSNEINSTSPSVGMSSRVPQTPRFPIYKCEWRDCQAQIHNLETLRKHVHKRHGIPLARGGHECLWADCGTQIAGVDPLTGIPIERHQPLHFTNTPQWTRHLEVKHFGPISWQMGDGPASGMSDANESASESCLSDSQGRRVTPRIIPNPERLASVDESEDHRRLPSNPVSLAAPRRGRPPKSKSDPQADARNGANTVLAHKRQVGGTGFENSGASLANEKRRKGLNDNEDDDGIIVDLKDF